MLAAVLIVVNNQKIVNVVFDGRGMGQRKGVRARFPRGRRDSVKNGDVW